MIPRKLRMTGPLAVFGSLFALVGSAYSPRAKPVSLALRIESLSRQSLRAQVSSTPPGLWLDSASSRLTQAELVLATPSVVMVADSVRTVRVLVLGSGAVRLYLEGGA